VQLAPRRHISAKAALMAKELWQSTSGADWLAALDQFSAALEECGKPKLPPLERYMPAFWRSVI
jgi:hypothetical protein